MKRISTQLVVVSVLCLGYCGGLFAQATSQISGTVKDATGGVVVGAEITVTQTDTGVTRSVTSDASGDVFAAEPATRTVPAGGQEGRFHDVRADRASFCKWARPRQSIPC